MRKLLITLSALLAFVLISEAQAPAFINYQGVARNSVGNALVNQPVTLRLTVRDGNPIGNAVYRETRKLITNAFGLFNVQIGGAGATDVTGSISAINWFFGKKWLQVEIDPEGGSVLKDIGTSQLISVPYSLYANQSGDIVLPFSKSQGEDAPLFKLINTNNSGNSLAYEGLSSSTANNATAIRGIMTSVSPGVFSAAVTGQNNGAGANGIGVYGNQNGTGWGVYGTTPGGVGVYGNSTTGIGLYGQSLTGASVMGFKNNNGQGNAGLFHNTSPINYFPVLSVQSNGPGDGASVSMTGLGNGSIVNINNPANVASVFTASGNGLGKTGSFQNINTANNSNVLEAVSNGTGRVGYFNATNSSNAANSLEVNTAGTGFAASFTNTNATPKALRTAGAIQFTGVSEGPLKVLSTVDGSGNATWQSAASINMVSGSGTLNYVPKWTPDGTIINNSLIFDNGTNVGISTTTPTAKLFVHGDFIDSTTTTGFAATFINNDNTLGDGIKIKLGKAKSIYSPPAIPSLVSDAQITKIKDLIRCDYPGSKISLLGDIVLSGALEDLQAIGSLAVGTGNLIINKINAVLGLPLTIGPYGTPEFTLIPYTEIFGGLSLPALPDVPSIHIGPYTIPPLPVLPQVTVMPSLPNINLSGLGIPSIPITDLNFWGIPADLCLNDAPGSTPLNNTNEFIRFADKNDAKMGSIRAVSVTDWASNYLNPLFLYSLYGALTSSKVDKFHAQYHFKGELTKALKDYAKLGVEYSSGNGDYAEWLERADNKELITAGDIVAVSGGKITRNLSYAEQVMVVSHNPIVLGNVPKEGKNYLGNNIAFMGQVPVKVMGPVAAGDYIVGQKNTPGYGIAKHQDEMTIEDFKYAVGRSWDTDLTGGPKMVNAVVGVHNGDYLKILKSLENKINESESRLQTLESKVDELIKINPAKPKKPF